MREHSGTVLETDERPVLTRTGEVGGSSDVGELVSLAAAGDDRAWSALVDRFTPLLWGIARSYRLSSADAADVVQMTWLRLMQHLPDLRQRHLVGGWLATTARRESLAIIRRVRREEPQELDDDRLTPSAPSASSVTDAADADAPILRGERDRIIRHAVLQLPPRQQLLLRLLSADPPPNYREISKATGIPIGSIGPTRARALARLRTLLAAQGFHAG
jgi:RNA polymerase sigma factor (sigma-70 family)